MIRDLLDRVAGKLGYIPKAESDDIIEVYARRILELGDEIEVLKRKVTNLTGMLAAADGDRERHVADIARKLRVEELRLKGERHANEKLSSRYDRLRVVADAMAGVVRQLDDEL